MESPVCPGSDGVAFLDCHATMVVFSNSIGVGMPRPVGDYERRPPISEAMIRWTVIGTLPRSSAGKPVIRSRSSMASESRQVPTIVPGALLQRCESEEFSIRTRSSRRVRVQAVGRSTGQGWQYHSYGAAEVFDHLSNARSEIG